MRRAAVLAAALLSACATGPTYQAAAHSRYVEANYRGADRIADMLRAQGYAGPVMVASFASVDNLQRTSRLGRSLSEQYGSRLTQAGLNVIEVRLRNTIFVSSANQGEFLLSREAREISAHHKAAAVVTGTYADAGDYIYVTVRAIELPTNRVIASHDYALPGNGTIRAMLGDQKYGEGSR